MTKEVIKKYSKLSFCFALSKICVRNRNHWMLINM